MRKALAYLRISTDSSKQRNSIEVQRAIIGEFCKRNGYELVGEQVDEQSAFKDAHRPGFNEALSRCEQEGLTLIVWKIDRLSRNLSVFSQIQHLLSSIRVVELGDSPPNIFALSTLLAVAQQESINTSVRVSAAIKHLRHKAEQDGRRFTWGNPDMTLARKLSRKVRKNNASEFNTHIQSICADLDKAGYDTIGSKAEMLRGLGLKTRRGKDFSYHNLRRVLTY